MRAHTYRLFVRDVGLRGGAAVLFHHGFGCGCGCGFGSGFGFGFGTNKTSTGALS
jgi:hypothetical protein